MKAGLLILRRNGVLWSESELLGRLVKMYLQHWRGTGPKSASTRRYNLRNQPDKYVIRPWYVDQVLYASVWDRSVHTGESLSRMVDFAVRHYIGRLLAQVLRRPMPKSVRGQRNAPYWASRYAVCRRKYPDVFINYSCATRENRAGNLEYVQVLQIIPKTGLTPGDILYLMRHAA